jgi:hypothetical protein
MPTLLVLYLLHGGASFARFIAFLDRAVTAVLHGLAPCFCFGRCSFYGARKIGQLLYLENWSHLAKPWTREKHFLSLDTPD